MEKEIVSSIVSDNLPNFVKEDYSLFSKFAEYYYKFLDQQATDSLPGPSNALRNSLLYQDIDYTIDQFVLNIKNEYAIDIPENILADKPTLYKNIKDYYLTRGSQKSLEFIFSLISGDSIEVAYPSENILRASDGKWVVDSTIQVTQGSGEDSLFELKNKQIIGQTSGAKAVVENVLLFNIGGVQVFELYLNNQTIDGAFQLTETVTSEGIDVTGIVYAGLASYPGYYLNVDGQLSENIKLQDSLFYQAYSYVIKTSQSIESWRDIVTQNVHPAGLALFGEVSTQQFITFDITNEQPGATILTGGAGVSWLNNSSAVVSWLNKYNNQVLWVTG